MQHSLHAYPLTGHFSCEFLKFKMSKQPSLVNLIQEFSIPLILGVACALLAANLTPEFYSVIVDHNIAVFRLPEALGHLDEAEHAHWEHYLSLHFLVNDIFMVFFFGIAAKEITESCLPGGTLNPISKAINPLLGTLGGVLGPVFVYLGLNAYMGQPNWQDGWGIPTATDIALAWLIAKLVFGKGHPAISFLLLLAVADDAIGLFIIAFKYPSAEPAWLNTLWILPGVLIALGLRKAKVSNWIWYVAFGGAFVWYGLYSAHLHPALALVFIVPFMPGPKVDSGIFEESTSYKQEQADHGHSPLEQFEHSLKIFVDFGLFFFAFTNAGVAFSNLNELTWIVFLSLFIGKTLGITLFSYAGSLLGIPLPTGMRFKHLITAGMIAGLGLTVALFVCGQAFKGELQGAAKMGALLSGAIVIPVLILGKLLRVNDYKNSK